MTFLSIEIISNFLTIVYLENLHNLLNLIPIFKIFLQLFKQVLKLLQFGIEIKLSISIIIGVIGFFHKIIPQYELINRLHRHIFVISQLFHIFTTLIDIINMIFKICTRHFP